MDISKKVLVVEDDKDVRSFLEEALHSAGYQVWLAEGVEMGLHLFRTQEPDVVILDIRLPDGSGFEICQKIREHKTLYATPVIMLTAQAKLSDKESGVEAGADQYLVKPISARELLLWVQAVRRRLSYNHAPHEEIQAGHLTIDLKSHLVHYRDQVISDLTGKEFDLLYYLVKSRPIVLSRKYIIGKLWHTVAVDNLVDTHICHLRHKLPVELADKIQSVPGKGFRYFE